MMKKLLFKIAKGPLMGRIVGTAFQHCGWAIPVKKVYSSKEIIAFHHPQPSYENHLILSPKKAVRNLQTMAANGLNECFVKIWESTKEICRMHSEYKDSFVLVANGGKRQEVQQVHFHMFTNHEMVHEYSAPEQAESIFYRDKNICILVHPKPDWEIHFVIKPNFRMEGNEKHQYAYFRSVLHGIDVLDAEFDIVWRGYSLVYQHNQPNDMECPIFHIVSGKKQR